LKAMRRAAQMIDLGDTDGAGSAEPVVNVVLVGRDEIAALNSLYLGHTGETDVIAFDLRAEDELQSGDEPSVLGEVYACLPVAVDAAGSYGTSPGYEALLYVVHGLLHLSGEDDMTPAARRRMKGEEDRIMATLTREFPVDEIFA